MIKVALVEDDARFRKSLSWVLQAADGIKCVAEYGSGEAAITGLPTVRPDVVLMDLNLPDLSGAEVTARLKSILPDLNVVVLTVYNDAEHIFEALRAGACGYLLKQAKADQIISAVKEAREGGAPMTGEIARKVLAAFAEPRATKEQGEALAAREQAILELLAKGFANKEIADKLSLTSRTVDWYLYAIYRKLHVHSRTQAVSKYLASKPRVSG